MRTAEEIGEGQLREEHQRLAKEALASAQRREDDPEIEESHEVLSCPRIDISLSMDEASGQQMLEMSTAGSAVVYDSRFWTLLHSFTMPLEAEIARSPFLITRRLRRMLRGPDYPLRQCEEYP